MVNSKRKLLKLALTLTRLSVQSIPELLLKLSSQLSAARCTGKQVLRFFIALLCVVVVVILCCVVILSGGGCFSLCLGGGCQSLGMVGGVVMVGCCGVVCWCV